MLTNRSIMTPLAPPGRSVPCEVRLVLEFPVRRAKAFHAHPHDAEKMRCTEDEESCDPRACWNKHARLGVVLSRCYNESAGRDCKRDDNGVKDIRKQFVHELRKQCTTLNPGVMADALAHLKDVYYDAEEEARKNGCAPNNG